MKRRIFVTILSTILLWNSAQVPGSIPQVYANGSEMTSIQETTEEETVESVSDIEIDRVENVETISENNLTVEETIEIEETTEALIEETAVTAVEKTTEGTISEDIATEIETESISEEETTEFESVEESEEDTVEASSTEEDSSKEDSGEEYTEELLTEPEETISEDVATEIETETETENEIETESISQEECIETAAENVSISRYNRSENAVSLSEDIWIEGFERESDALRYTGGAVTQNLQIYHNGNLLKEGKDYKLTYRNNVNAGEYYLPNAPSVRISMVGQYSGNQTLFFTIEPRDITDGCAYETEQIVYYKKKLSISVPEIILGDGKLSYRKDYECDYTTLPENYKYGDSYEEGTDYEYTVNGKGNFTGSFTVKLIVLKDKKLDFQNAVVELDKESYEYNGVALSKSDVSILSVKAGKTELAPELYEYSVFADGAGTGYVKVYPSEAGKEAGYAGMKELEIDVIGDRSIEDAVLGAGWQESVVFSKKALDEKGGIFQSQTDLLVYGEEREALTEGVDYSIAYYNNGKIGQATVVFTGIGRYRGTLQKTYDITPNLDLQIVWKQTDDGGNPVTLYAKGGVVPQFSLIENAGTEDAYTLSEKTDYTVKVTDNRQVGFMTCEITGKGNFKGYSSVSQIEILSGDIGAGTIEVEDRVFSEKANAWKAPVVIRDANGTKLWAGIDYDQNLIYSYEGMELEETPAVGTTIQVTAVGKNQFEGSSITAEYRICAKKIKELVIKIDDQVYTGSAIELDFEDIHVYESWLDYYTGVEMISPCYEIAGYSNNKNTGKAKVTLRGIGEYGAEKTYTFKIVKKKYEPIRVSEVALDETELSMGVDSKRELTAAVLPLDAENKTILWMTSDSRIATVDKDGIITAKSPGKVTIMAISQDGGKKASCDVTVAIIPVKSFSLNTDEITGFEGTTYQLEAADILPADALVRTIQWESSQPEIAAVDENGQVSLKSAGMAVIKAYSADRQFVRHCMVFVEKEGDVKPEGNYLTPQMFRTSKDSDDTKAFNRAIQNLGDGCDTVYVPSGTYYINAEVSIVLKSNMNLILSDGAILQALGNSNDHSDVILVRDVSGVTITGGNIRGERYQHNGSAGEWGMGIGIYDSTNIHVDKVSVSNCWGDGIYIGSKHDQDLDAGSTAIRVTNSYFFNNRRNNMSIVCAENMTVDNCRFEYANGTSPEYGIDIETNNSNNPCEHITISNSTFTGNGVAAMGIVTTADDINIVGCVMNGAFINYAGTNVTLSNTTINGEMCARIGVDMEDGSVVNDGSEQEDVLVAHFLAGESTFTLGKYGINDVNQMSGAIVEDEDSVTGNTLQLKRLTIGNQESGFYLDINELTEGLVPALKAGVNYRFEYSVKGNGFWGTKTNQTGWYPIVLTSERYTTGFTTYRAKSASSCQILFYAVDKVQDMMIEIESFKIYEVR